MADSPAFAPIAETARLAAARDGSVPRPVVVRVPFEQGGGRAGPAPAATSSIHAFPAARGRHTPSVRRLAPRIDDAGGGQAAGRPTGFSGDVCSVCNSAEMVCEAERLACRNCGTTTRIA